MEVYEHIQIMKCRYGLIYLWVLLNLIDLILRVLYSNTKCTMKMSLLHVTSVILAHVVGAAKVLPH